MAAELQPGDLSAAKFDSGALRSPLLPSIPSAERRSVPRRSEDRRLKQLGTLAQWLIEHDTRAIFVLDSEASVLLNNAAAQRLCMEESWAIEQHGRLELAATGLHHWLLTAMASNERRACLMGSSEGQTLLRIHRVGDDEPNRNEDVYILTVGDTPPGTVVREDLRDAFGLTPAEAAVASELYMGKSLALTAQVLQLSVNTVKTHVKRVFRKCSVRSHVQLVKRIDGIS